MTTAVLKTTGQVRRELSQRIRSLYKQELGHKLSDISCHFFESRLVIVLEGSLTTTEKCLFESGDVALTEQVHQRLSQLLAPKMKAIVEEIVAQTVVDVLSSATIKTGRTGIIMVMAEEPDLRK